MTPPAHDSLSPDTGRAFATWTEPDPDAIAARLARLAARSDDLLHDMDLRRDVLDRAMTALRSAAPELVELTVTEVGKTPAEAAAELPYAESFLQTARQLVDDYAFVAEPGNGRRIAEVPPGLGLLVAPYNDPIAGLTRKIGPCLAAGAGAIVKPSGLGVQTALALGRHLSEAGLDDFVAVLPIATHDRIDALIESDAVGTVSFTGSTEVGIGLAVRAARHAKRFVGELGGTNPFVILNDADAGKAVEDLVSRKIRAAGQACSAQNIVHVERGIADEVVDRIAARLSDVAFGPARAEGVGMGPVRTSAAVRRLASVCARLEAGGARLLQGGIAPLEDGRPFVAPPTAYLVDDPGLLAEEEVFGPLLGIRVFDDRARLRAELARNRQPLVLYVYGGDRDGVDGLVRGLRYGSVGVNTTAIQGPDVPTGGFRFAGVGREGGRWGLSEFVTTVNRREYWS